MGWAGGGFASVFQDSCRWRVDSGPLHRHDTALATGSPLASDVVHECQRSPDPDDLPAPAKATGAWFDWHPPGSGWPGVGYRRK